MSRLRSPLVILLLLTTFGGLLRIGCAIGIEGYLADRPERRFLIAGDAEGYWELAGRLSRGESYRIHEPPRYALRMPGFPALLAASIRLFGDRTLPARIGLAILGTLAIPLVFLLARVVTPFEHERNGTALLAAGMVAVSPVMIGFSPLVLSETAFAVTLLLSLLAIVRFVRPHRSIGSVVFWAMAAGVSIGIACFMRPVWLLIAPGVGVLSLILPSPQPEMGGYGSEAAPSELRWPLRIGLAVLLVATTVGTLLPWGQRNARVTGQFTLTTWWVGPSLYDGLSAEATGESDMTFFDRDRLPEQMTEPEVDREYRRRAWAFAEENPRRALELTLIKLGRFWNPIPNADQFQNPWLQLAVAVWFVPLIVGAMIGTVRWWRAGQSGMIWRLVLTLGPILYLTAIHAIFIGSLRYRLPAEYPLAVLAASGWLGVRTSLRFRNSPGSHSA